MITTIAVILLIIFVIAGVDGAGKQKNNNQVLLAKGYSLEDKVTTGKYIAGHPDINESIPKTIIFPKENKLDIMLEETLKLPQKKGEIDFSFVKNVLVEDQSTVEKRVTVGRLLLTGVFAFAWKKKKKVELAYLTLLWNDGRFDHETIFEFEGVGSMQKANLARNQIIKLIR